MDLTKRFSFLHRKATGRNLTVRSRWANIGCGRLFHPDWDNFDLTPADDSIRKIDLPQKLPLPDRSYEMVYCSHVIEHISRDGVEGVLKEFLRILQPGGILRLVVPDLARIASAYLEEFHRAKKGVVGSEDRHEWMTLELLDQIARKFPGGYMLRWWQSRPVMARDFVLQRVGQEAAAWIGGSTDPEVRDEKSSAFGLYHAPENAETAEKKVQRSGEVHRWMYDEVSLSRLLREAGFDCPEVCSPETSRIAGFRNYHLDTTAEGLVRKPDSLFMEAVAPS